jgi:hypothetical protein
LRASFNCSPLKQSTTRHEEAMLIFNDVTSALRFLRDLEQRVQRREKAAAAKAAQAAASDDDIPFWYAARLAPQRYRPIPRLPHMRVSGTL